MGTDAKTPGEQAFEHAVELCVYAPIGLVFAGTSLLPELVDRGRNQVKLARVMGKYAVGKLHARVAPAPSRPVAPTRPARRMTVIPSVPAAPSGPVPDTSSLAIPDYDGLSASQVVNRLAGLTPSELEAVRSYEAAQRGRKTILSKVAQLQG